MRPLYVVCNGGYRTGSTVAYNVAREVLCASGIAFECGLKDHPEQTDADLRRHAEAPFWAVTKSHVWLPMAARGLDGARVIFTHRDPLDVAASLVRMGKPWDTWDAVLMEVQRQALMARYMAHPAVERITRPLMLRYEDLHDRPRERILRIVGHLGLSLDADQIDAVHERTNVATAKAVQEPLKPGTQDEDTLIQSGHVGGTNGEPGTGAESLGPERTEAVRVALRLLCMEEAC